MPTPEQWRFELEHQLDEQARNIELFERYYNGDHRMAFVTAKYREAFGEIFASLVDNWCETVVDIPVERLGILGFRIGDDQGADDEAWRIWKANSMPSQEVMAHTEAVKCGMAYVMVAPGSDGGPPRITVEHPSQVTIAYAAGDRSQRLAALKRWQGIDGYVYETLYLPDSIHKWKTKDAGYVNPPRKADSPYTRSSLNPFRRRAEDWEKAAEEWEQREEEAANPLGEVPIWELANNPSMLYGGRSDLGPAIPLQDAINKEIADMLIASEFASFPQRVIMGIEVPTDEDGKPLESAELKSAMSRIWMFEDPETKIGEFKAADLKNYVEAVTVLLQHLAAQTRTPPHYLLGQIVNASGDALKAAETGLVAKAKRKQLDFADTWQLAMRAALKLKGRTGDLGNIEVIWRDPEFRSEGEAVDGAVKLKQIGIPFEALWERIGATPEQIKRWAHLMDLPERRPFGHEELTTAGATPV